LEENLTHNFLGIEVGFKLFSICSLEMVGWTLWKYSTYTLQLFLGAPLKARYLHNEVSVWVPFQNIALVHYSCSWWPFWKQGTYTLQLIFWALWKH